MTIKRCPHCQTTSFGGNYCSQCGTKLVDMPQVEETCPCCGGTGKIKRHSEQWYHWQAAQPIAYINQRLMNNTENKE